MGMEIILEEDCLNNFKNYYCYADMIRERRKYHKIYVPNDINPVTINDHINAIYAILQDGITTDYIGECRITVSWGGDLEADLGIVDYWFNLFMWSSILDVTPIRPKHLFWNPELRRSYIKEFIDKFLLTKNNRIMYSNFMLNDVICESMFNFSMLETFSYYLAITICNEDDIALMNANPRFRELMHTSFNGVPFEDIRDRGMELAGEAADIIKHSKDYIGFEHSLTNSFKANEAIKLRQFKEVYIALGTKPSRSGVYPYVVNKSFKTGGVNDPLSYFIESNTARAAQIISKTEVADSGAFARLLGLNNIDTLLYPDPNFECFTRNFIQYEIKSAKHLSMIKNRYYRTNPNGMEYVVDDKDTSMIGRVVYLRSPITCTCNATTGHICRKCYGELYFTNLDVNTGKIAAELASAQLTQQNLSAKHVLETNIVVIPWNDNFRQWMETEINTIRLSSDLDLADIKGYKLVIDPEEVTLVDDFESATISDEDTDENNEDAILEDLGIYKEFITKFSIVAPNGIEFEICSDNYAEMYITDEFNQIIRKKSYNENDRITIPLVALFDEDEPKPLFTYMIYNNELSKTLNDITNVINKASVTRSKTKDQALQDLVDLSIDGGLEIDAVHFELLLSNQVADVNNVLIKPDWTVPYVPYRMLTLNEALTNNQSIIISLLYQDINKVLYNPLSFKKRGSSFFDLFYMEKPQLYMNDELLVEDSGISKEAEFVEMCKIVK